MDTNNNFPNISSPFVNESRYIEDPWRRLLLSLWNRTGQGQGVDALSGIAEALLGETEALAPSGALPEIGAGASETQLLDFGLSSQDVSLLEALVLLQNDAVPGQLGSFTPGSVLFADSVGAVVQNNAKFFWDNTNFALGIGAAPPVSVALGVYSTVGAFVPPSMTTTQRDALTASAPMIIYNSTFGEYQAYKSGAWGNITVV